MKKIVMSLCGLMFMLTGHAQNSVSSGSDDVVFNAGKMFASAQLSNLDCNYTGFTKFHANLGAKAGGFIIDDLLLGVNVESGYYSHGEGTDSRLQELSLGGFMRYYIEQNGIYLGLGANWSWKHDIYNDFQPEVNVGYAFFLSRTVTIEPELYYRQSFVNHSKYSAVGFRLGFSIYLDDVF
jgi:hypothetical protein